MTGGAPRTRVRTTLARIGRAAGVSALGLLAVTFASRGTSLPTASLPSIDARPAAAAMPQGYWLVASDGGNFPFGASHGFGSTGGQHLNAPIVGMASTPSGQGYWLVASDGGIFPFGDAGGFGSTGGMHLNAPIVGMASTPSGQGYWLVASDGGIFPFGDAQGLGSEGGTHLNKPIVGMAATPSGNGYWLVASDGGIFPFGDAQGLGSEGGTHLNKPIVGMAATPDGGGYWLVASDGGIFPFGDAGGFGSTGNMTLNQPIVGMAASPTGLGYWLVASDGGIFPFGDAQGLGSEGGTHLNQPVVGMAAYPALPPVSVTATPASTTALPADQGASGLPVTFHVTDRFGHASPGASLLLTRNGLTHGSLALTALTANSNGDAATTFFDTHAGDTGTITGTVSGSSVQGTSGTVNVVPGPATQLVFTTQPNGATGGTAFTSQPSVSVEDAYGNVVTGNTNPVTLAITGGTGTAGASLTCTANPKNAVAGVATFTGCRIDKAGSGYTLTATQGVLHGASTPFTVSVGPATKLAFTQQPTSSTGGVAFPSQPAVAVEDAGGNTVTSDTSQVTLSITGGTGTAGASLSCTGNPQSVSSGVAGFAGCSIDKAGADYTLTAADGSLTSALSSALNVTVGPAAKLAFTTEPGNGTGGSALGTQPAVTVQDAGGNTVTTDGSAVTLSIRGGTGTTGAALTCTSNPLGATSGVAGFSGCAIDKAGTGYQLHASDGVLSQADSTTFNVTVGPAAKLAFTTEPSSGTGGTALGTQPVVTVQDAGGNTVTTDTSNVTLSITSGTGTPGAALSCTTNPLAASSGVAGFSGCSVDKAGTSYKLHASDGSLTLADSTPFDISVGAAAKLGFVQQPSNSTGGTAFPVQPSVAVEDAGGNTVSGDTSTVTLSITAGTPATGGPGTLTCTPTTSQPASAGVAAFSGCAIDTSGTGYTLHAVDGSLTPANSATFTIGAGAAAKLAFTQEPTSSTGGSAFPQQPKVSVEDAGGNLVSGDTSQVTLSITAGTPTSGGPGTLTCTSNPLNASGGVASFAGCAIDKVGTGYQLHAVDTGLAPADSSAFDVTVGAAAKLAFTQQPSSSSASQTAFAQQPKVSVEDAGGNLVSTDGSSVTLSITAGTPATGGPGTLGCTPSNTAAASGGVATFAGCQVDIVGTGYRLHAADGSLTATDSSTFAITPGTATKLVFSQQPSSSATGGTAFAQQPKVTVEDGAGNTVTGDTSAVTLSITAGTPTLGGPGTLACTTNPVNAISGVAAFAGCNVDKVGTGYKLHAADGSLATADSSTFNITVGPAAQLVFTQSPTSSTGGVAFPQQPKVTVEDAGGNTVATDSSTVTLAIAAGTPTSGGPGALSGCSPVEAAGVVTFSGCKINTAGTGYRLTATDATDSLTTPSSPSAAFNITVGPATQVGFSVQPSDAVSQTAISPAIQVQIQDAGGNLVSSATNGVGLVLTTPNGATLSGTTAKVASGGVASFNDISVDKAGSYTLTASSTGLNSAVSNGFTITHGLASKLFFSQSPSNSTGGTPFATQPIVVVQDPAGNTVTNDTSQVTLTVTSGTGTPGAQVTCTTDPLGATSGVAQFLGCAVDKAGSAYTLHATDGSLTPANSGTFNITVGAAAKLAFTQQPSASSQSQTAFAQQPVVKVEDAGGNVVTGDSSGVTLSITPGTGTGGALLHCTTNPVTASSGAATFAGCNVDLVGSGYTLHAADSGAGVSAADSSPFAITPGNASKLAFTQQPTSSTGGVAFPQQPQVSVEDGAGNVVTGDSSVVTLSITPATGAAGAALTCNPPANTATASSGVAAFTGCAIDKASASNYQLHAVDGALTPVDSAPFAITVGPAVQLGFVQQPNDSTGGTAFPQQPKVAIQDAGGNTVTGNASTVTLSITGGTPTSGGPGALSCSGGLSKVASAGVATFSGCAIDKAGSGYKLHAVDSPLTTTDSSAFNITVGTASQLVFTTEPSSSSASQAAFAQQPAVSVEDAGGNVVTTDSSTVTLAIKAGTPATGGPGTLAGCSPTETLGVVTFSGCNIDKVGTGYVLHATDSAGGVAAADSTAFAITPGTASKLAFTTEPNNSTGGTAFSHQPVVSVEDNAGNTVTGDTSAVTLSITAGTPATGGPGALSCTTNPLGATAGVASFAGCRINTEGAGYQLHAVDGSLTPADSTAFTITVGTATQVVFTTEPNDSTGGVAFPTQPVVTIEDAGGNTVTTNTSSVTLAITTSTGAPGATLSCSGGNTLAASSGVASFSGCSIDKAATNYKLHASDGSLATADSTTFNITVGSPAKLAFTTQPSSSTGGVAFPTQPAVAVEDAGGNTVTTDTSTVGLNILSTANPGPGTLTCNPSNDTQTAVSGVATFTGCSIDVAGNGYRLHATDGSLTFADSNTFNITVGSAAKLAFTQQPSTTSNGGAVFAQQPKVTVEDAGGNTVSADTSNVSLTLTNGTAGANLTCTNNPQAAASGVASFAGCKVDKAGSNYGLHATDGTLAPADSATFTINVGTASQLAFTGQPGGGATGGVAFPAQPAVTVQDAGGNTITTDNTSTVTLSITPSTPTAGGPGTLTCSGGDTMTVTSGVASFGGCKIDTAGTGYELRATDSGFVATTDSSAFDVAVGPATHLAFTRQPNGSTGGVDFSSQPKVSVEDAGNNVVTTDTSNVTLAITAGTPTSGGPGTLTCAGTTQAAVAGVSTFQGCNIDKIGTGYELHASDGTLGTADSSAFNITLGPASQLVFTTQPGGGATGGVAFPTQPVVTIEDAGGNTEAGDTSTVTLSITAATPTSGGPGTLSCTGGNAKAASAGVATFAGCKIDAAGTGYELHATDPGVFSAGDSNPFSVAVGPATKLAFTQQPNTSTGGTAFTSQPKVSAEDAGGNVVTTDTSSVTLSITAGTPATGGPGTLTCTGGDTKAATAGVAAFAGCSIDTSGTGYRLHAVDGSLATADSTTFDITAGAATKLVFTQQPSDSTGGTAFGTQPKVVVEDAGGNVVTTDTSNVLLSITPATGAAGAALNCTTNPVAATSGVAAFAGCNVDKASAVPYQLHAADGTLTPADSATFTISVGPPAKLAFTQQPSSSTGGTAFGTQPKVAVEDLGGNPVTTDTTQVALVIKTGTGTTGATLDCSSGSGNPVNATAGTGVAAFSGCTIDKAGTGYQLHATDGSLTAADSAAFDVTVGTPFQLVFSQQPTDTSVGAAITPAPAVTIEDKGGNVVTTATNQVGMAIGTNAGVPSPGTLSGTVTHNAVSGVATFSGLSIDQPGTNYTLSATSAGLTTATSTAFKELGTAMQLAWVTEPAATTTAGQTMASFQVAVEDAAGNILPHATNNVAITSNPLTTVNGTTPQPAVNGVATFNDISINKAGTYTFTANSTALTNANSTSFTINPAAATQAVCTLTVGGAACPATFHPTANQTTGFTLTLEDQFNNPLDSTNTTTYNVTVTLTKGSTPDGGSLSSTASGTQGPDLVNPATVTVTIGSGSGSGTFSYIAPVTLPPGGTGTVTFANGASTTLTTLPASMAVAD